LAPHTLLMLAVDTWKTDCRLRRTALGLLNSWSWPKIRAWLGQLAYIILQTEIVRVLSKQTVYCRGVDDWFNSYQVLDQDYKREIAFSLPLYIEEESVE
jgi:hypothetical protein